MAGPTRPGGPAQSFWRYRLQPQQGQCDSWYLAGIPLIELFQPVGHSRLERNANDLHVSCLLLFCLSQVLKFEPHDWISQAFSKLALSRLDLSTQASYAT